MEENVITEYIVKQDKEVQEYLWTIYDIFEEAIGKNTTKLISYQIPTYKAKRNVIHFATFKKHIGIYPGPKVINEFKDKLEGYNCSKGTIQIKFDQPIPKEIIREIALYAYELNK